MNKRTRLKRLKMLSNMLKKHDKLFKTVAFDMNAWEISKKAIESRYQSYEDIVITDKCKSAACAAGSACLYPPFKKMGLRLKGSIYEERHPSYKGYTGWSAVGEFFGICEFEAKRVFDSYSYAHKPKPKTVAKRVDSLVRTYQKA